MAFENVGAIALKKYVASQEKGHMASPVLRFWKNLDIVSQIPRSSGQEQRMGDLLVEFAKERNLKYDRDESGNVLIILPSTAGMQGVPKLAVQAHQDMVALGEPDPAKVGVELVMNWNRTKVRSKNKTTAGTDNGVGLSALMTLADEKIPHGEVDMLFTVKEETGLDGAAGLGDGIKKIIGECKALINVDWEKIGEAAIGSAGGGDSVLNLPIDKEIIKNKKLLRIVLENGKGGHSGVDIHKGRANAIRELALTLKQLNKTKFNLVSITGGVIKDEGKEKESPIRNAIPPAAEAVIAVDEGQEKIIKSVLRQRESSIKDQFSEDKKIKLSFREVERHADLMLTRDSTTKSINLLTTLPTGLESVKREYDPLAGELTVQSANLAIVRTGAYGLRVDVSSRAVDDTKLAEIRKTVDQVAQIFGAENKELTPYPACDQDPYTPLFVFANRLHKELTGREFTFTKVHGGLEFGYWRKFWPHMSMFAFGPTINDPHSTSESMLTKTVPPFLNYFFNFVSSFPTFAEAL